MAWNLAKEHRVLFLEPPLTLLQPFREVDLNWRHLLNLGRLKYQGRNLYSYSPVRLLPLSLPGAERFNYYERDKKRTINTLKKIVGKLKFNNPILWIYYSHRQYDYYGLFNEKNVVADWYDDFSASTGVAMPVDAINKIREKEEVLLKKADIIFTPSKEMKEKLSEYRGDVNVILHGVDFDLYRDLNKYSLQIAYFEKLKKPILCYLGIMHTKIDFDLLRYISSNNQDWTLLLVGKKWFKTPHKEDKKKFLDLIKQENVVYCKEVKRELVSYYLSCADVCLIPFKNMQINYVTSAPLKLFEYFAAGKPVVATDLGREYRYPEMIRTATTYDGFCEQIKKAIPESKDQVLIRKRRKIAEENSWAEKVRQMMQIIEDHLMLNEQN